MNVSQTQEHSQIQIRDISKTARHWNFLRNWSNGLFIVVTMVIVDIIISSFAIIVLWWIGEPLPFIGAPLLLHLSTLLFLFALAVTLTMLSWRHGGILQHQSLQRMKLAWLLAMIGGVLLVPFANIGAERLFGAALVASAGVALTRYWMLNYSIAREFSLRLEQILANLNEETVQPGWMRQWRPKFFSIGFVWVLLAVLLVLGAAIGYIAVLAVLEGPSGRRPSILTDIASSASKAIHCVGILCLLRARRHFLPTADFILGSDNRKPILYLRSFVEDTNPNAPVEFSSILDRSLEMSLARHFGRMGPFVAIGSPTDKLPPLGAFRMKRLSEDWQGAVGALMEDSQTIVVTLGVSYWLGWEFSQTLQRGFARKTVFLFPEFYSFPRQEELLAAFLKVVPQHTSQRFVNFGRVNELVVIEIIDETPVLFVSEVQSRSCRYLALVLALHNQRHLEN